MSNSLVLPPVFCVQKSLEKMSLSIFTSYQKYLEAHKCFILLWQLTHELAMLTTLEHKPSAILTEDQMDFNMEDEYSSCLTSGRYRELVWTGSHPSSQGNVLSWVSTDVLSSWLSTRLQSYVRVDYLLPSWILVIRVLHCTGSSNICS